jgi:uncharacterized protein YjiS (DUF1127 family)/mono/diheme cytochrome c family protein
MELVMTDAVVHPANPVCAVALRAWRLAMQLGHALGRIVLARAARRALNELPDILLADMGLVRADIPSVVSAIACGCAGSTRDAPHRVALLARSPAPQRAAGLRRARVAAIAVAASAISSAAVLAQDAQIKRGRYLVNLGLCNDCHTPGYFFGKPDSARFLGGSEVGFEIPGLGVFHGPNLTPDRETGLGTWSADEIKNAITKGQRPDGRVLAPIMPWHAFANLTGDDAGAIVAFLKSLPPVSNKVPGPFGAREKPTSFVMKVVPPAAPIGQQ